MQIKNSILKIVVAAVLACAVAAAAYFFIQPSSYSSSKAFLTGDITLVTASTPGEVQFIASQGQKARRGDILLQINAVDLAKQALELEQKSGEIARGMPGRYSSVLAAYLSIEQSEEELEALVKESAEQEIKAQAELEQLTEQQAALALNVRKLELQTKRSAEQQQELDAMLLEEELLNESVKEQYGIFEGISLQRAGFEKQLTRKRNLGRTLATAPAQISKQLGLLHGLIQQMQELEDKILASIVNAPYDSLVIYTMLEQGQNCAKPTPALYFIPQKTGEQSVEAYFAPKIAEVLQTGQRCSVTIGSLQLEGRVGQKNTYPAGATNPVPVQILLPGLQPEQLIGINPQQQVQVTVLQ